MLAAALAWAMPARAQVDLEPFLKQDMLETIRISPSGAYYAMTVPLEDQTVLAIIRRSDGVATAKISVGSDSVVDDFWWVNDERVVLSKAEKYGSRDHPYPTGELYAINADGSANRKIFGRYGLEGTLLKPSAAFLFDAMQHDERKILVSVFSLESTTPMTRAEELDVYNGRRDTVASAPVRRATFTADAAGKVRFAHGSGHDNVSKLYYRDGGGEAWRLINDEASSLRREWPVGFAADGKSVYLQVQQAQGPDALVRFDPATGQRTELLRDAVVDPYSVIHADDRKQPEGSFFMHQRLHTAFFDEGSDTARLYRKLERAFPGQSVAVTSSTRDGRLKVVHTWSDTSPGDFFLFDATTNQADLIFSRRSWLEPATMSPSEPVTLAARDGLALHGYLTRPRDHADRPLPMVLLPHGGPFGIFDEWAFDDEAQLLARAGYAVLRVNFRGSGNYGRAFLQAGARQWGKTMQDDLTDATKWAVEQGIADPRRICIYGASYGAYAALMGVSREPELYRCAVGYVGVYDLVLMHRQDSRTSRSSRAWIEDWISDDRTSLAEVSPTERAAHIRVPVFLAAGGKDDIAPIAHSERMERALKAAGVPVETLYIRTEGHGFYTEPHRREYYTRLLDFLSRHLGGQKAK